MKKLLLLLLLLTIILSASAQKVIRAKKGSEFSTYVTGNNFIGIIFNKEYTSKWLSPKRSGGVIYADSDDLRNKDDISKYQRFTPDTLDIDLVESLLQSNLKGISKKLTPSGYWCGPNVFRHIKKYTRQYFGFYNEKMEKIIFIYCFWDDYNKNDKLYFDDEFHFVFDGGSYFWQIKINLRTHQLFDFGVNGAI